MYKMGKRKNPDDENPNKEFCESLIGKIEEVLLQVELK